MSGWRNWAFSGPRESVKDMMSIRKSRYCSATLLVLSAAVLALVLASSWQVFGQSKAEQADPKKPAEPKYTEIKYSADQSSYRWQENDRILVLTGSVKFVQATIMNTVIVISMPML